MQKEKKKFLFCSLNNLDLNVTLDGLKGNKEKCPVLKVNVKFYLEVLHFFNYVSE